MAVFSLCCRVAVLAAALGQAQAWGSSGGALSTRGEWRRPVRVAVASSHPHLSVGQLEDGSLSLHGPLARLMDTVAVKLGLRLEWVPAVDGLWGAALPNGSYNGMVGMVQRQEVDLALGPFGMTSSRAAVAKFSFPVFYSYYRVLVRRGHPQQDIWSPFKPLSVQVWTWLVLCFAVLALFISLAPSKYGPESSRGLRKQAIPGTEIWLTTDKIGGIRKVPWMERAAGAMKPCAETVWFLYAVFVQQTQVWRTAKSSLWVGSWLLCCLVVVRSYNSGLTSQLAVRRVPVTIHSFQDLVQASKLGVIVEASTAFTDYIQRAEKRLYEDTASRGPRVKEVKMADLKQLGASEVLAGRAALVADDLICFAVIADHFRSEGDCGFLLAKEALWPLMLSVIGQRHSDLVDLLSQEISRLVESDIYNFWLKQEIGNYEYCQRQPTSFTKHEAMSLKTIWVVLGLLGLGHGVAVIVFLGEVVWASRAAHGKGLRPSSNSRLR